MRSRKYCLAFSSRAVYMLLGRAMTLAALKGVSCMASMSHNPIKSWAADDSCWVMPMLVARAAIVSTDIDDKIIDGI